MTNHDLPSPRPKLQPILFGRGHLVAKPKPKPLADEPNANTPRPKAGLTDAQRKRLLGRRGL